MRMKIVIMKIHFDDGVNFLIIITFKWFQPVAVTYKLVNIHDIFLIMIWSFLFQMVTVMDGDSICLLGLYRWKSDDGYLPQVLLLSTMAKHVLWAVGITPILIVWQLSLALGLPRKYAVAIQGHASSLWPTRKSSNFNWYLSLHSINIFSIIQPETKFASVSLELTMNLLWNMQIKRNKFNSIWVHTILTANTMTMTLIKCDDYSLFFRNSSTVFIQNNVMFNNIELKSELLTHFWHPHI